MKANITLRPARPEEAAAVSALMLRSKAHWGYDADFMQKCVAVLTVTPEMVADGSYYVAVNWDDAILGVTRVERLDDAGRFELDKLFVEPTAMGSGIGRVLFDKAAGMVRANGGQRMEILSDPGAAPFYERMGATRIGEAPSDAIPGRMLPLLELDLTPR